MASDDITWSDYQGGGVVNLMSSIGTHFGWASPYASLDLLPPEELEGVKNFVLLILDGMRHEFLSKCGQESSLVANLRGTMTSVFPTTTAAAMSTIYTGLAPQNYGIPGWFTYLRELGLVATILPMIARGTGRSF
jgi:hypothetical protein